jgi:ribonuclease PH
VLDLDYPEDSTAHTDGNFVLGSSGSLIEIQATADEVRALTAEEWRLLRLARIGCDAIFAAQRAATGR